MLGCDLVCFDLEWYGGFVIIVVVYVVLCGEECVILCCDLVLKVWFVVVICMQVDDEDVLLLLVLKVKCCVLVEVVCVFVYVIFVDKMLIEMVQFWFCMMDDMVCVNGVGVKKLDSYGEVFLQVIVGDVVLMYLVCKVLVGWVVGDLFDWLLQV